MGLAMDPGSRYHRPTRVEPPFGRTEKKKKSPQRLLIWT